VDSWSERSGFGQWQWGGMNSENYKTRVMLPHDTVMSNGYYIYISVNGADVQYCPIATGTSRTTGLNTAFEGGFDETGYRVSTSAWNTGYGSGSGSTSYYNDCVACCAD